MATIIFNGKSYNSIEEMPANERQAYEQIAHMFVDKNGNGIPDFLEGDMVKNVLTAFTSSVNFNGQTYNSTDELPPEVQAKVQSAFVKMADMGLAPKDSAMVHAASHQIQNEPYLKSTPFISQEYNPAIQEDKPNTMMWIVIGMALMICLAVAAVGIFFFLR